MKDHYLYQAHVCSSFGGWILPPRQFSGRDSERVAETKLKQVWGDGWKADLVVPSPVNPTAHIVIAEVVGPTPVGAPDWAYEGRAIVIWFANEVGNPLAEALAHIEANGGWDKIAKGSAD